MLWSLTMNSTVAVSCRASTGPVHQQTPVLFEPTITRG